MLNVTEEHKTVWRLLAELDDQARGRNGVRRSELPDSPIGRDVWFSPTARRQGSRPQDLAEGWSRLAALRQERLSAGDTEAGFVQAALGDSAYGPLYRFILQTYWEYDLRGV